MCAISSEGVTPPSSLLQAHVPLPLGSPLLRHLTSFEESLQVVPTLLPTGASRRYLRKSFLGCWIPYPGGTPCALTCFFHDVIGLPQTVMGRLPAYVPRITTSRESISRGCRYSFMFRPPSLLTPQIVPTAAILPQGSRGFYIRAYRALLPPHAPDMLTVRTQVIDGTGTFTLSDSQPCRLLPLSYRPSYDALPRRCWLERFSPFSRGI